MMKNRWQKIHFFVILCVVACLTMILVLVVKREPYDNTNLRTEVPKPSQLQNSSTRELLTARKGSNGCSIVHPKLNSCNTLPNYYLYPHRREDFQSAIINFWHIQKAGGSSVGRCLVAIQDKLHLPRVSQGSCSCDRLKETWEKVTYFQNESFKPVIQGHNTLGFCDFFSDINFDRKCSTFAIFRDPYDRTISHYYFARKEAVKGRNKGYERALKLPITEWVKTGTSPMWVAFHRIWRMSVTKDGGRDCKMIPMDILDDEWPQNETNTDEIIDNLDKHLSFVGLMEDMLTTYEMLEEIYNLPFVNVCYGRHVNKGKYENMNATKVRALKMKAKRSLMEDEDVRKSLTFDIRLYEKAKEIFQIQKNLH